MNRDNIKIPFLLDEEKGVDNSASLYLSKG